MVDRRPSKHWSVIIAVMLLASLSTTGALGQGRGGEEPSPTPIRAANSLPTLAEGDATVRFSLAPATAADSKLTVLTRWRSCGTLPADDEFIDWVDGPQVSIDTTTATAHLVESADGIRIRVDVGTGPTGETCESRSLVRIPVTLSEPLGERTIHDAGDASYEPVINEVDSPETSLVYSCSVYGGGVPYSVLDLLGPGLEIPAEQVPPTPASLRIVRADGDEVHALGTVKPNGKVPVLSWFWRDGAWRPMSRGSLCHLVADSPPNQNTATWRLRGKRPTAKSKTVNMWVKERVCNGRPLYGRVAQPTWINVPDGIVLVLYSMRETVLPDGTYIDDPWEYYKGKPGVGSVSGGYQFIDCPGIGPAPYTVNLHKRLGDRKLFDGAHFPPRPRPQTKKAP